ncbi:MAG: penicillin acylase family protein [Mesorhizobium sp.]|nr:penicillin acylase family protein [Mesorhizobium sp. M1A.F.Ca.IN.022.02.1.1]RWG03042.1 MAG: penicillin acylase family protein [Mesorhizobium sp.]RWG05906.1 MAG: penicillin acylase family protein [Mesorhizobium sp.]RWG19303.1 MAG: penicillin acylase family protein [Mesorhizobium sp.]RWG25962.1 MAG: penicillin acylase family protein [Mesorhizobium sp.]
MSTNITIDRRSVTRLKNEVTINVDRWGVAHIRAENLHDLFFAQGWNAARDRLWQIDIARKRGLGLLSRDFGPGYLEQDRAARLLLYRGNMSPEWVAYGSDSEEICSAFAEGINSYVDSCNEGLIALPPEFVLLGHAPDRWKPEDVVRVRTHSLTRNATSELLRSKVMALAGAQDGARLDGLRQVLSPAIVPRPVEGFDPAVMTDRVLRDFHLATSPVSFSRARLAAKLDDAGLWTNVTKSDEVVRTPFEEGSNSWAVAASKTTTGRPMLALDPHRNHVLPSVRYVVHLSMPGLNVIGAGEPMVPGISMGHNGTASFAITIFGTDQEDIYVYDLKPDEEDEYSYKGAWEQVVTIKESIPVCGHEDQQVELRFTRHGPVLYKDAENKRAFALRTVWMDSGMAPYMASLAVMRAKTHAEYVSALACWGCPSVNHIYADISNTIAWNPSGAAPIRRNWDGLLPVPGDGRFEWDGYLSSDDGPSELNPVKGFVATANAMNVPQEWSRANPAFGHEWSESSRHETLHSKLSRLKKISLKDCMSLQCSVYSPIAYRILKRLRGFQHLNPATPEVRLLFNWDAHLDASSAAAALFEIWLTKHLGPRIARLEGADEQMLGLLMPLDPSAIASWLEQARPNEILADSITASLASAWAECIKVMGHDSAKWSWGRIHKLELLHPLQGLTTEEWSLGPIALGGSGSTLNYSTYRQDNCLVTTGPSVRMIIDVGAWDNSVFINNPGQSGVPLSEHYHDLVSAWQNGDYKPLLYSQQLIDRESHYRISLSPTKAKTLE